MHLLIVFVSYKRRVERHGKSNKEARALGKNEAMWSKNAELEKKGESIEGLDWVALQQEHKQAGKRLARLSTVVKQAAAVYQNAKDQTRQSSRRRSDWRWCWRQTETRGRGRFQSCTARNVRLRVSMTARESEARKRHVDYKQHTMAATKQKWQRTKWG
ncbi:hypothetical protein PsorP6_004804 [Peronosclerospora sorghi]|uniref:Uncharacterized protein n=1 Tax=Peronosclerospora sorghi TaxID=230839 RepID=A0ACC0VKL9_9STRA|nr:hypothetical protein PsorP6_004804 [Peronosclerospora sorghi]